VEEPERGRAAQVGNNSVTGGKGKKMITGNSLSRKNSRGGSTLLNMGGRRGGGGEATTPKGGHGKKKKLRGSCSLKPKS